MEELNSISLKKIFSTWWPLALSWFLMALELPALSAVIARLPNPKINLAAYGGIVFPLALMQVHPHNFCRIDGTSHNYRYHTYLLVHYKNNYWSA
jgi:hypothetical protein